MAGNYILMMLYTTVCGWMLYYFYQTVTGKFVGASTETVNTIFSDMLASPAAMG